MKNLIYTLIGFIFSMQTTFAIESSHVLGGLGGATAKDDYGKIREGNIHINDIPGIINGAIDFLMGIAGTIAVIFVIVGGYKIALGSLEQDKTKGKETIFMALAGFVLAAVSGKIIKLVIDNF